MTVFQLDASRKKIYLKNKINFESMCAQLKENTT